MICFSSQGLANAFSKIKCGQKRSKQDIEPNSIDNSMVCYLKVKINTKKEGVMTKFLRLKFFGLITVVVAVLVIAAVSLLQAGKPQPPQWDARIPAQSLNLAGMDGGEYIYYDSDDSIRVIVTRSQRGGEVKYFIKLFIYQNDGSIWAKFQDIIFDTWELTGEGELCGFPFPHNTLLAPGCVKSLMEDLHPLPGYEHLMIMFDIYTDIEDKSLYPQGIRTQCNDIGNIMFFIWNSFECDNPDRTEPWYHTVSGRVLTLDCVEPAGFYITRVDENKWWIEVSQQEFNISEHYCWEERGEQVGKSGKYKVIHESYVPFEGFANLSYILELIKNIN